ESTDEELVPGHVARVKREGCDRTVLLSDLRIDQTPTPLGGVPHFHDLVIVAEVLGEVGGESDADTRGDPTRPSHRAEEGGEVPATADQAFFGRPRLDQRTVVELDDPIEHPRHVT